MMAVPFARTTANKSVPLFPVRPRVCSRHPLLQIDVLVLYSDGTFATIEEETQLLTNIVAGFSTANEATTNSGIDLHFNLVRVDRVSAELHPNAGGVLYSSTSQRCVFRRQACACLDIFYFCGHLSL